MGAVTGASGRILQLALGGERFVTLVETARCAEQCGTVALQRSLKKNSLPSTRSRNSAAFVGCGGLVISAIAVAGIARSISRPVLRLAESAHHGRRLRRRIVPTLLARTNLGSLLALFQTYDSGVWPSEIKSAICWARWPRLLSRPS